jgi:hypothetical protein
MSPGSKAPAPSTRHAAKKSRQSGPLMSNGCKFFFFLLTPHSSADEDDFRTDQPAVNLWTFYTNNTCNPPSLMAAGTANTCTLGYLPVYVIMATKASHIQAGILFSKKYNLRLLIRNTGHDFMGRSAAWGSLAINTHSFKNKEWIKKYDGPSEDNWTGSAVKLGSGVQGREIYTEAFKQDPKVVVVGGECPVGSVFSP